MPQAGGRDAVGAAFVFLDLLEADADLDGQLLLGQAQQTPAPTQAAAQVQVDVGGHGRDPRINVCPDAGRHTSMGAIAVPDRVRGEFGNIAASEQ
ncbi:hypothetical protein BREVUG8_90142 [Brevundimonas sp. G8]|nr:hypothetical protein BREVUG8_90142 [Brevundimonas sp. G8]